MEQTKADTTSKKTNYNQTSYFDNRHAFIVGINAYKYVSPLQTAINDAQQLNILLKGKYDYNTHLCENPNGQILRGYIDNMAKIIKENDCVLFYFAGHGIATDSEKGIKGFIIPADASINDETTLIPMSFLLDAFSQLKCKHFLVILDCCFAGAFRWAEKHRGIGRINEKLFQQHYRYYANNPSWQVLTSTSHTQKALDYFGGRDTDESKHSPFAHCLIDGLNGQADLNKDKIITLSELFTHLQSRFAGISKGINNAQNVGLFPLEKHGNGEFMFIPKGFEPEKLEYRHYKNPYMGLKAYTSNDDSMFFGREKAKQDLLEKIKYHTLTVIIGASGTGKSSLVKAGILPELRTKGSKIAEMRPNKDPIMELSNLGNDFDVLVIDQFEEIITQSDPIKAAEFTKILRGYIKTKEKSIILTVRIDFEPQIHKTGIEAAWQSGRYLIPPFMPEELREVIITPAARVGRFIDSEKLVSEIVNEVVHYPGSLPLLSFTLSELFERCKGDPYRNIKYKDYQDLGGVTGSLQESADRIVQNCTDDAEKLSLRNIMLRMVSIAGGETAGKRVLLDDLAFENSDENKRVAEVIDKLLTARLIVKGLDNNEQEYIEPAHDALIRAWSKLYEWIQLTGLNTLLLHQDLTKAVYDYQEGRSGLWHNDKRLNQLENPNFVMNTLEKGFVQRSIALKKRNIRNRNLLIGTAFLIISIAAGIAYWQRGEAKVQQKVAEKNAIEATTQRDIATKQTVLAETNAKEAQNQTKKAQEQRIIAQINADTAKKRLDQFLVEQKAKLEQERQKEKLNFQQFYQDGVIAFQGSVYFLAKRKFERALSVIDRFKEDTALQSRKNEVILKRDSCDLFMPKTRSK
jgi:Caspase domain